MLTADQKEGVVSGAKLVTAWAAVGVTSWADVAAALAALYSALLVGEFIWKKIARPLFVLAGWVPPK
jgi:hypothetical protein